MEDTISQSDLRKQKMQELSTHFGTMLGIAGLTSTVLDRAFSNLPLFENIGLSLLAGLLALVGMALWLALAHRDNVYHLVARDKGGGVLFNHVRYAKECIICTHFTKEPPSHAYAAILKEKLNDGVTVRRLIKFYDDPKGSEYSWLAEFESNDGYEQIAMNVGLPFNVVIIDRTIVWIFFPLRNAPYFRNAIWFKDKDIADLFNVMLEYWQHTHSDAQHRRNRELDEPGLV
jgi:hypothetical protein